MKLDIFPSEFEVRTRADAKKTVDQMSVESSEKIRDLENRIKSGPKSHNAAITGAIKDGVIGGLIISIIIGLIFELTVNKHDEYNALEVVLLFSVFITVIIICLRSAQKSEQEVNTLKTLLVQEKQNTEKRINDTNKESERMIAEYATQFERSVADKAAQYVDSKLTEEIVQWLSNAFAVRIERADRSSRIERINIPFEFNVFCNCISCNKGILDFQEKRWENLQSCVEQAALARVLASAIQLQITMRFPQDPSGSGNTIDIKYSSDSQYQRAQAVELSYSAANGYYKPVRSW